MHFNPCFTSWVTAGCLLKTKVNYTLLPQCGSGGLLLPSAIDRRHSRCFVVCISRCSVSSLFCYLHCYLLSIGCRQVQRLPLRIGFFHASLILNTRVLLHGNIVKLLYDLERVSDDDMSCVFIFTEY